MLKIQFKRKKPVAEQCLFQQPAQAAGQDPFQQPVYGTSPFAQEFGQVNIPTAEPNTPANQDETCLFCGSEITGAHLSVTTKSGEHQMHTSCIVSGFALLVNGVGLLFSWLSDRKRQR